MAAFPAGNKAETVQRMPEIVAQLRVLRLPMGDVLSTKPTEAIKGTFGVTGIIKSSDSVFLDARPLLLRSILQHALESETIRMESTSSITGSTMSPPWSLASMLLGTLAFP